MNIFSNRVPEHSNYITSKNTEVSTQTEHQTKNNIQISTAGNNHRTITASEKKNDKNHKKFNISHLNLLTCNKIHVNNFNNNEERELWIRTIKNLRLKKLRSKSIQSLCIKKTLHSYSWRFNSGKSAWKTYCK